MPTPVYLDLSELVAYPLRTGIQRVEREAIRHWPGPARLAPCCIDNSGRLLRLPTEVLDILCAEDSGTRSAREAERQALAKLVAGAGLLPFAEVERLLNMELFFGSIRANVHRRIAATGVRMLWYLHDFIPFLRPDLFPPGTTRQCMHFLRGLRTATDVAFVSEQTRRDYKRVARMSGAADMGPVVPPGADGLQLEPQTFSRDRRDFVSIGTIEPRKNSYALLAAFELLWQAGTPARLIIVGRLSDEATQAQAFFARHANNSNLVVIDQPADETLRAILRHARAVVMPSEVEGFGLPPYEAVHVGIPALASIHVPSAALFSGGAMLLERMDSASIAAAIDALMDDAAAARLWDAAASVRLPTWKLFGRALGEWAQAI